MVIQVDHLRSFEVRQTLGFELSSASSHAWPTHLLNPVRRDELLAVDVADGDETPQLGQVDDLNVLTHAGRSVARHDHRHLVLTLTPRLWEDHK